MGKGAAPKQLGGNMSEYSRRALEFRLAARIISESCESCLQREFDFIVHDAFVCESCAAVAS